MAKLSSTNVFGDLDVANNINVGALAQFEDDVDILNGDLTDGGNIIYDQSASHIPQARLQNDSVTVNAGTDLTTGGTVSLGNSVTIDHANTSSQGNVSAPAGGAISDVNLDGNGHVTSLSTVDFDGRFVSQSGGEVMDGYLYIVGENAGDHPPRMLVGADDDTGQTDIGFEVRGNASGGSVDMSHTNDSTDTKFAILGNGRTLIGYNNLASNGITTTDEDYLLDVNDNARITGELDIGSASGTQGALNLPGAGVTFSNNAVKVGRNILSSSSSSALDLIGFNEVNIYGNDTGQYLLQAFDNGNVDIPNGSLSVSDAAGSDFVSDLGDTMSGGLTINGLLSVNKTSAGIEIRNPNYDSGDRFYWQADGSGSSEHSLNLYHEDDSGPIFVNTITFNQSGNVEIPNGNLTTTNGSGSIDLRNSSTNPDPAIEARRNEWDSGDFFSWRYGGSSGSESTTLEWYDNSAGTQTAILGGNSNGSVEIPNGSLSVSDANGSDFVAEGGDTMSGVLDMGGNNINNAGSINLSQITSNNGSDPVRIDQALEYQDDIESFFGNNADFSARYDSSSNEWVLRDETNGVDLIRQPKAGPTQFIQGADIGSIEAPEDSFTQVINAANTSATTSGDTVGYTFAVDNQSALSIQADSDGSGGISNKRVDVPSLLQTNTITDSGEAGVEFTNGSGSRAVFINTDNGSTNITGTLDLDGFFTVSGQIQASSDIVGFDSDSLVTIWDDSNKYVPQSVLQNDSVTVSAGNALTGGGSVSLGGSTTIDVDEGAINADQVDGYDIQKNGTDGNNIINFKT